MGKSRDDRIRWLHVSDFHLTAPPSGADVPYEVGVVLEALIRVFA